MKHFFFYVLLVLLVAAPNDLMAQKGRKAPTSKKVQTTNKPWATFYGGVLTFTYGPKPKTPSQIECVGCGYKIPLSSKYCSNCGKKISKFEIFEVPLDGVGQGDLWNQVEIKKVVFSSSFKQVTNIKSTKNWFRYQKYLTSIIGLDYLNTSQCNDMSDMFSGCTYLASLDVSHFDTSNVKKMSSMFDGCENLTSLDVSHFDTSNVENMSYMFQSCKHLTSLDLTHFNTSNVLYMNSMFAWCENLSTLNLSSFNTSNVYDMTFMFKYCSELKVVYVSSGWDTKRAKERNNASYMFHDSPGKIKLIE